jgi:hypothetical protein
MTLFFFTLIGFCWMTLILPHFKSNELKSVVHDIEASHGTSEERIPFSTAMKSNDLDAEVEMKSPSWRTKDSVPRTPHKIVEEVQSYQNESIAIGENKPRLLISKIQAESMKSVELIGENDLYVVVSHKTTEFKTSVAEDSGANAVWGNLDFIFEPNSLEDLVASRLEISVFDKNSIRSDVLIGKGFYSLASVVGEEMSDSSVSAEIEVVDKNNLVTGKVFIDVRVNL